MVKKKLSTVIMKLWSVSPKKNYTYFHRQKSNWTWMKRAILKSMGRTNISNPCHPF